MLDQIPAEGSNPSADKTIWLDFAGGTVSDTDWNADGNSGKDINYKPADALSAAEKLVVYQRIVQSYSAFDVNITIKKPSAGDLRRSSMDDAKYGAIVHVTDSSTNDPGFENIFDAGAVGKAQRGSFGDPYTYDAWVTTDLFKQQQQAQALKARLANKRAAQESRASIEDRILAFDLGTAASHELGHTLGLVHHGYGNEEYYSPGWADVTAKGASIWGPIMGHPLTGMVRWSNGYDGGNNNDQDDLALITKDLSKKDAAQDRLYDGNVVWTGPSCYYPTDPDAGHFKGKVGDDGKCNEDQPLSERTDYTGRLDYRANQEAGSDGVARVLSLGDGGKADAWGEFTRNLGDGKGNWYRFDSAAGQVKINVTPQGPYSMLDLKVTLYDAGLKPIATADPDLKNTFDQDGVVRFGELAGQGAEISQVGLGKQTYFVKVEQSSFGNMKENTADKTVASPKYGGLGTYQIAVEGTATAELAPPTVDPTYGQTVTGTGVPGATVDIDNEGGKLIGSAKVGPDGKYTVKLDPAAKVGDELLVSQSQEGLKSRPVAVTVVSEEKPEVKVKVDPSKITKGDDSGVTVIGSGFESGQKVTGVVNSEPVDLGVKLADEKGNVEFVFDAGKLEVGKHKVTLTAVDDKDYSGSAKLTVVKAPVDDDDDNTPSPSPSPDDDDNSSPSPDPDGGNETPPPTEDGSDDDGLPGTGASTALTLFGIGGLVLIGSGATIAVAARRRIRG
ncbi:Ig-like domain-containing protein [Microlunatus speluncae]|uniref:Ig-like domain-containing protein n=1 Tax=Microlunatus speluncae TaxID=2594267 RepID=UPI001FE3B64B|nr:Ig-like domain-containing protein [Microlunatus speluncae]